MPRKVNAAKTASRCHIAFFIADTDIEPNAVTGVTSEMQLSGDYGLIKEKGAPLWMQQHYFCG